MARQSTATLFVVRKGFRDHQIHRVALGLDQRRSGLRRGFARHIPAGFGQVVAEATSDVAAQLEQRARLVRLWLAPPEPGTLLGDLNLIVAPEEYEERFVDQRDKDRQVLRAAIRLANRTPFKKPIIMAAYRAHPEVLGRHMTERAVSRKRAAALLPPEFLDPRAAPSLILEPHPTAPSLEWRVTALLASAVAARAPQQIPDRSGERVPHLDLTPLDFLRWMHTRVRREYWDTLDPDHFEKNDAERRMRAYGSYLPPLNEAVLQGIAFGPERKDGAGRETQGETIPWEEAVGALARSDPIALGRPLGRRAIAQGGGRTPSLPLRAPDDEVIRAMTAEEIRAGCSPDEQELLRLKNQGFADTEIGPLLGHSCSWAGVVWHRLIARLRRADSLTQ